MVEKVLRVLNREWSGLHEAAFLLAGTALCSQVFGLIRDRLLAGRLGAGDELDIYYAAFRVPDFLYASIASFVAVTVLIPFFLERMEAERGREEARRFISSIATWFFFAIAISAGIAFVLMPHIARYIVPGFSAEQTVEFIALSRLLLLSPVLLGFSNLFGTITQSLRRFAVFALGPILYNAGILLGIILLMPTFGLSGVAVGVLLGAAMHLIIQIPVIVREGLFPRLIIPPRTQDAIDVMRLSIPRTIALSAGHFGGIVLIAVASTIGEGSIAVFTLAMNIQSIPLALVGMSYSVAAFPTLAKLWTEGDQDRFLGQIVIAARHIAFWSFPAIVLFIVLRAEIVRTLLGTGAFDWTATKLTAAALALFALSVIAQNLNLLLTRAFYAMGRTTIPLFANVTGAVSGIVFALSFLYLFKENLLFRLFAETLLRVSDIEGTAVLMLPFGYSLGALLNAGILLFALRANFPKLSGGFKQSVLHAFTVSIIVGAVAYIGRQIFANIFDLDTFMGIFAQGLFSGIFGILTGIFLLWLMNNKELAEIWESLHRKFWKSKPIVAEQESI
jgi:putative peptidoglycan lipid II flippase